MDVMGDERVTITNVTLDASYPTGGYPLTPAQLGGLGTVRYAISSGVVVVATGPSETYYNIAAGKLQCFSAAGEIANATSLAGAVCQVVAYGY